MKIFLKKPKKSDILIYDKQSIPFAKYLFKKKSFITYNVRYESINLSIFVKTLIKSGYKNFFLEYKKNFFQSVNPKIVYTSIDNNVGFYKLKNLYPKAVYIADQNGMRDNIFYNSCLKELKHTELKCDFCFVFGSFEKKRLEKIINSNFIVSGNTSNNLNFYNNKKKKKIIIYISSKITKYTNLEKKIFFKLIKFCSINKYKLLYLDRLNQNNSKVLYKIFSKNGWTYVSPKNLSERNLILNKSDLVTFAHSTLGHECLSRGYRCISFDYNRFNPAIKNQTGKYWCKPKSYNIVRKKIFKVMSYTPKEWNKITNKNINKVLIYNKDNIIKKKIINNILKKFK